MNSHLRRWIELGRAWWRADRIRVSARASRLLRLPEGSAIRVGETKAIVRTRIVDPGGTSPGGAANAAPAVFYTCLTASGVAELEVRSAPGAPPELGWRANGREVEIHDADVHVYRRRARGVSLKSPPCRGMLGHD